MQKFLSCNQKFRDYFVNSIWMLIEYLLKIFSGVLVSIYVARYLGPNEFGELSYALAISGIFLVVSRAGMDAILVRELSANPEDRDALLTAAFRLMSICSIFGYLMLSVLLFLEPEKEIRTYVYIISLGILFQSFMVVDYEFQAQVKAKYSSISKSFALIVSSLLKVLLVYLDAGLLAIVISYLFDIVLVAICLFSMHLILGKKLFFVGVDNGRIKCLIVSAVPMTLSALAVILYMRVDQIMIKNLLGDVDLGLYSAATKVYEGWLIIPYVVSVSLLPFIVESKKKSHEVYVKRLGMLFSLMFWSSCFASLFVYCTSDLLMFYSFGADFLDGSNVLTILMFSAVFSSIGSMSTRYLTVEGKEKKIFYRTLCGLIINIALNTVLIPAFGIEGAAVATLISLVFMNYLVFYLDKDLRDLFHICNSAITFRWWWYER